VHRCCRLETPSLRQNVQYCDHRGLTYADWQAWWYDAN
jgi:hypothetical protein